MRGERRPQRAALRLEVERAQRAVGLRSLEDPAQPVQHRVSGVGSAGQGDKTAAGIQHGQDMLPENEGIPLGEELRRKKDIRHPPLRGRFKPVDGAAVDEQPAADFHAQPLGADQAVDLAGVDRDEFELPVPMPRDGLSAELIEIVVIILEREFRRAVRAQLPQGFVCADFCDLHGVSPHSGDIVP